MVEKLIIFNYLKTGQMVEFKREKTGGREGELSVKVDENITFKLF